MATLEEDAVLYLSNTGQNASTDFQIILSSPLSLTEAANFEVALLKLHYPSAYNNILKGAISYYSFLRKKTLYTRIPDGYYPDPESFIEAFNKVLGGDSKSYQLTYVPNSKLFLIQLDKEKCSITLSESLTKLCGLPTKITGQGFHTANTNWEKTGGNSIINVLCSLANYVHVNNTKKPLLLTTSFGAGQKAEGQIQYEPNNPIYVPINEKYIQSIAFKIQNEHGQAFPFASGGVMIAIHIRPASPRL